ncbi:MAG: hypothetical protein WCK98_00070 [bacterium]
MILITLLGQTSSGKSEMAVELAKTLLASNLPLSRGGQGVFRNVEASQACHPTVWIVNCDSRQVFKELNIGTGKVEGKWVESANFPLSSGGQGVFKNKTFHYKAIPHFLIDYVAIEQKYNVSNFVQDFIKILDTQNKPDYVILTGGTGLYAKAIYNEMELGQIQPDFEKLFNQTKSDLQILSLFELQENYLSLVNSSKLKPSVLAGQLPSCPTGQSEQVRLVLGTYQGATSSKLPPDKGDTAKPRGFSTQRLNNSDFNNPRRLQSFLLRNMAKANNWYSQINYPKFEKKFLFAIAREQDQLKKLIEKRLQARIQQGLLQEVQTLIAKYGHPRIEDFGLEYRLTSLYLKGHLTETDWKENMLKENLAYAKRQLTWLKKEPAVWVETVEQLTKFLKINF